MSNRQPVTIDAVRDMSGGNFDSDAWIVMQQRDDALIADEVLGGAGSSKFVYSFDISGKPVAGISVVGARHLASHYGGIQHKIIASVDKTGALHRFTSYPAPGQAMRVETAILPELAAESDYYECLVEVKDIKTGNVMQMEKREAKVETRRDGTEYERPHFRSIAQSKAFRNGVLALVPQDVAIQFMTEMLKLGKNEVITASVIAQKRAGILAFAAKHALPFERRLVEALPLSQITALSEAAHANLTRFRAAAEAVGLLRPSIGQVAHEPEPQQEQPAKGKGRQAAPKASGGHDQREPQPPQRDYLIRDARGKTFELRSSGEWIKDWQAAIAAMQDDPEGLRRVVEANRDNFVAIQAFDEKAVEQVRESIDAALQAAQ